MDALEFRNRNALAARDAHQVREQQVDGANLAVALEPGARLLEIRELRHGIPECLRFSDGLAVRVSRG